MKGLKNDTVMAGHLCPFEAAMMGSLRKPFRCRVFRYI